MKENDRYTKISKFLWMEFSIEAEFRIIEETCKAANRPTACFPVVEISIKQQFAAWLFQIPDGFR